jgi:hypothetical protein
MKLIFVMLSYIHSLSTIFRIRKNTCKTSNNTLEKIPAKNNTKHNLSNQKNVAEANFGNDLQSS